MKNIELYGREEFLGRNYAKDNETTDNPHIQKPLFLLSVILSPFYDDFDKVKACLIHNLKNKVLTHEVRITFNFSLLSLEVIDNFKQWCGANGFLYSVPVVNVKSIDDVKEISVNIVSFANAVITFDSSKDNSYIIEMTKNYALRHKLLLKSY
jgi:hypothetical protein